MRHHRNTYYTTKGGGVGNVFSSIFKSLLPVAQKLFSGAKNAFSRFNNSPVGEVVREAAKRTAVNAGLDIAADAMKGESIKSSMKKNLRLSKLAKNMSKHFAEEKSKKFGGGKSGRKNKKIGGSKTRKTILMKYKKHNKYKKKRGGSKVKKRKGGKRRSAVVKRRTGRRKKTFVKRKKQWF